MMRTVFSALPFFSILFFPFALSVLAVIIAAFISPLVPLAAGIFAELLYGAPHVVPVYGLLGAGASLIASLVHRFVETSIIKG